MMSDPTSPLRDHLLDAVKAAPQVGFWTTWFWGVDWTTAGAFVMFVYAILLVLDKAGLLKPLKAWCAAKVGWPRKVVPEPLPPLRYPQDE